MRQVFLKQFRDAAHGTRAHYQSVVEAPIDVKRLSIRLFESRLGCHDPAARQPSDRPGDGRHQPAGSRWRWKGSSTWWSRRASRSAGWPPPQPLPLWSRGRRTGSSRAMASPTWYGTWSVECTPSFPGSAGSSWWVEPGGPAQPGHCCVARGGEVRAHAARLRHQPHLERRRDQLPGPAQQAEDAGDVGLGLGDRRDAVAGGDRRRAGVVGGEGERDRAAELARAGRTSGGPGRRSPPGRRTGRRGRRRRRCRA